MKKAAFNVHPDFTPPPLGTQLIHPTESKPCDLLAAAPAYVSRQLSLATEEDPPKDVCRRRDGRQRISGRSEAISRWSTGGYTLSSLWAAAARCELLSKLLGSVEMLVRSAVTNPALDKVAQRQINRNVKEKPP